MTQKGFPNIINTEVLNTKTFICYIIYFYFV